MASKVETADWNSASTVLNSVWRFLLSRAGAAYLIGASALSVFAMFEKLKWAAVWSGPLLVVVGHLCGVLILSAGAMIGDGIAEWIVRRCFGKKLSSECKFQRAIYFLLSWIALPIGFILATLGDLP